MVAYNFQERFADDVENLIKRQTIRAERKGRSRHARPGESIQLYTGMRTAKCRKLVNPDPVVWLVRPITIHSVGITLDRTWARPDWFAKSDGFKNWQDMRDWFGDTHSLPFIGVLIAWRPAT